MSTVLSGCLGDGNRGNVSLVFPSPSTALMCVDNTLCYIDTGGRGQMPAQPWTILHRIRYEGIVFVQCGSGSGEGVNVLVVEMMETSDNLGVTPSVFVLRWQVIVPAGNGTYTTGSDVILHSTTIPVYGCFVGPYLVIASGSIPSLGDFTDTYVKVCDTSVKVCDTSVNDTHVSSQSQTEFEWTQTDTDVNVVLPVHGNVSAEDVVCVIGREDLVVGISDGTTLIRGTLYDTVSPDTSTWIIERDRQLLIINITECIVLYRIEVTLEKHRVNSVWPTLLKDDVSKTNDGKRVRYNNIMYNSGCGLQAATDEESGPHRKAIFHDPLEDCDFDDNGQDINIFTISRDGIVKQVIRYAPLLPN